MRTATAFITNPRIHELSGPDFLRAVADKEEACGNDINAAEYRRRAVQWQNDLDLLSAAPPIEQITTAASEWPSHLPPLRRASELPAHHITPSDHR